ncbi:MAG: creatininase family protein [Brachymonas sp.]|nr:creatininase family protein [Brachymonas sp.]
MADLPHAPFPPGTSRYWADWSTAELVALDKTRAIAVLPVAAIEQHGPHLPLKVDAALADGMVAACLPHLPPDAPVLFLPTQAVGYSPEHTAFAGTLTLSSATVIRLWTEIAECVAASGIQKLLIFNTHGGNVGLLDVVARDLRARLNLLVYTCSWFNLPLGAAAEAFDAHEHRFGIHAGAIETSLMLALHSQDVRMDKASNFASTSEQRAKNHALLGNGHSAKLAWQMQDYNPEGAVGNATTATAKKGQALLQATGKALADLLQELDQLPLETLRP